MKININYPQLAAEFVIVFVGVAVALAADDWRQRLSDRSTEQLYLERLYNDVLSVTTNPGLNMENIYPRLVAAIDAMDSLLDSEKQDRIEDPLDILTLMFASAHYEFSPSGVVFDSTYQEMLSTGNFNLIQDVELRGFITSYYRLGENLTRNWEEAVREGYQRWASKFRMATGNGAVNLTLNKIESEQIAELLDSEDQERLLLLYGERVDWLDEMREVRSRLVDLEVWLGIHRNLTNTLAARLAAL